jgi:hypothetical protein
MDHGRIIQRVSKPLDAVKITSSRVLYAYDALDAIDLIAFLGDLNGRWKKVITVKGNLATDIILIQSEINWVGIALAEDIILVTSKIDGVAAAHDASKGKVDESMTKERGNFFFGGKTVNRKDEKFTHQLDGVLNSLVFFGKLFSLPTCHKDFRDSSGTHLRFERGSLGGRSWRRWNPVANHQTMHYCCRDSFSPEEASTGCGGGPSTIIAALDDATLSLSPRLSLEKKSSLWRDSVVGNVFDLLFVDDSCGRLGEQPF